MRKTPAGPSSLLRQFNILKTKKSREEKKVPEERKAHPYPLHDLFGEDSGEIPVEPLQGRLVVFSVGFLHRNFPLLSGIVFEFVSRPKRWLASGSVAASESS